jgi:SagB-type dehydrogenase family enzyme
MNRLPLDALQTVLDYHQATKHHLQGYARSLGYMDWATQPDPFRTFRGAEQLPLEHPEVAALPTYDALFAEPPTTGRPPDRAAMSRLFYHSMAISAWKQVAGSRPWSLRVNPSSGDLHPTESYLISGPIQGLSETAGVFHYVPFAHALERRRTLDPGQWRVLTDGWPACVFAALTSIHWREAWKYGERAFRYSHLDVGHAIAAIALAAGLLGWRARLVRVDPDDLALLLGTHTQQGAEAEHADCLMMLLYEPLSQALPPAFSIPVTLRTELAQIRPAGEPNRLSKHHHDWPIIDAVTAATHNAPRVPCTEVPSPTGREATTPDLPSMPAEEIIRRRRSAVDMDGQTTMPRAGFFRTLARIVPALTPWPFTVQPWPARVALALFVHRVDDVPPGLYLLARDDRHAADLRARFSPRFAWRKPDGCPAELPVFQLLAGDARRHAKLTSCHQDIAADGVFAAAMLADFTDTLHAEGPASYAWLHWEAGLIGQVLYLEAEAAGLRATGIGCFFDDATHQLLGLGGDAWQTVYHFTVGGAVEDPRLQTLEPYHHLLAAR